MTQPQLARTITIFIIILLIASATTGFFIGRSQTKIITKPVITYDTLPAIHDTIKIDKKPTTTIPTKPEWLHDTIYINGTPVIKIDTMAILADWILKREYKQTAFDNDSIGKLDISLIIQYNKLQKLSYDSYPLQKTVTNTVYKEYKYRPFVMLGFNTANQTSAQVGIFAKHVGISYEYNLDKINNKIISNHGIKFGYQW